MDHQSREQYSESTSTQYSDVRFVHFSKRYKSACTDTKYGSSAKGACAIVRDTAQRAARSGRGADSGGVVGSAEREENGCQEGTSGIDKGRRGLGREEEAGGTVVLLNVLACTPVSVYLLP